MPSRMLSSCILLYADDNIACEHFVIDDSALNVLTLDVHNFGTMVQRQVIFPWKQILNCTSFVSTSATILLLYKLVIVAIDNTQVRSSYF